MNETTLHELLRGIAAETPRSTAVDSYAAVETARRQRERRRRRVLVSAAALIALVMTASVVFAALVTDRRPTPLTTPGPPAPTIVAPTTFDPAQLRVTPGWLPDGFSGWQIEQEARGARYTATTGGVGTAQRILVYVAPRGVGVPDLDSSNKPMRRAAGPGPEINGSETTWIPRQTSPGVRTMAGELRFRWAPDAQASVDVRDVQNAKDVAARIARELRVLVGTPTPLPFTTIRPEVPLTRLDISFYNGSPSMRVMYLANDVGPGVEFQINTQGTPPTTEQIGPYAVSKIQVSGGEYHYIFTADPDAIVMVVTRPVRASAELAGPAIELAEQAIAEFRIVGDVRDPSSWQ